MTEQERAQFYSTTPFAQADTSGISQVFNPAGGNFLTASARPTWERSSEGFLEAVLEGRLRGNMPESLQKYQKIISRPSKIEPWSLQNGAWSPPRRYF